MNSAGANAAFPPALGGIFLLMSLCSAQPVIGYLEVIEEAGLERTLEYVEVTVQLPGAHLDTYPPPVSARRVGTAERIRCQWLDYRREEASALLTGTLIFPLACAAGETLRYELLEGAPAETDTDLKTTGSGTEMVVENRYYRADLRSDHAKPEKSHASGQLSELLIKMEYDQLLTNAADRIHWAPNFERPELEYYTTIAHWNEPRRMEVSQGPWLVRTTREDAAPAHPEIRLSAVYHFFAGLPWFRFSSSMEFTEDLWLELLRNDEMTTDSMFTHVGFKRPGGEIVTLEMEKRAALLSSKPIEADAQWVCFFNADRGFGFGSIRVRYDNQTRFGNPSPTFRPHTQIGAWLDRRYWNRRLIHDRLTLVPQGSRYEETNAYVVFSVQAGDPYAAIEYWAPRLRAPLAVRQMGLEEH